MTAASLTLTTAEVGILASALQREHDHMSRQRAITEVRLAEGSGDADTLTRLAYYEECDLARLDGLVAKLPERVGLYMALAGAR